MAGLSSTFGFGATTNAWTDLEQAGAVLIAGANPADNHPLAMRQVLAAKAAGARVAVIDPRLTNTAAAADVFARLRPGSDIALLGAIINEVITKGLYDRDYVNNFTNGRCLVGDGYGFADGLFSGYDETARRYDAVSWGYVLAGDGRPATAGELEAPRTVFSRLKEHFSRYDPETAAAITGVPAATIRELATTVAGRRPLAILYALGVTQHTTAVQAIRCYAILSLLLGSVGVAGGGVNALRGEVNVQGATDLGCMATHLPGYLPVPLAADDSLAAYAGRWGTEAAGWLAALLRSWFGPAATAENDWGYRWLPRRRENGTANTYIPMLEAMAAGRVKAALAVGINPLVSTPDNRLAARALATLDFLAVVDLRASETAEFWRLPGTAAATEVLLLPAAHLYEKEGSLTSGYRWLQWQPRLLAPPAAARPDLAIIDATFRALRRLYKNSTDPRDEPIRRAVWDYGTPPRATRVLQEITAGGCWLYAGAGDAGSLAAHPGGWAWPDGERILYAGGAFATPEGLGRLFAGPYARRQAGMAAPEAVAAVCADGPLPEFYEPAESRLANALHAGVGHNPLVASQAGGGDFPYVLTTYTAGDRPSGQAILEISPALAAELALAGGDRVRVASARGQAKAHVVVSEALQPLTVSGLTVHTVAMPLAGPAAAMAVNALTQAAADPTAGTPAAKHCLVAIYKD